VPLLAANPTVGGQAVMEGVMIRSMDRLAIAVRRPDGAIVVESRPWFVLPGFGWARRPFLRGFPVLIETLVNGIKALNYSAQQAMADEDAEDGGELKPWALFATLAVSIAMALGLFVVLPHFISLGVSAVGVAGGVDTLSFHAWDGLFKLALFLGYIVAISFLPDIRRVFQYHGAEHKVIWAFENQRELSPDTVREFSRLHPRCGTAFLLFVLGLSIILYAILVPYLLTLYAPAGSVLKQGYIVLAKLLLMVPISCLAFELIKVAGKFQGSLLCRMISWPGLMMQRLTTYEPDDEQLEVAIAALKCAVDGPPACTAFSA
jgi:uncharacterized protein YqhQ